MTVRLISWNCAGRIGKLADQVEAIGAREPDIVARQEVTARTAPRFRAMLACRGLVHFADSISLARRTDDLVGARRYGQLIASRWPVAPSKPTQFAIPWKERVLSVAAQTPSGSVEIHTTHIPPGSSNGWIKIETLEGIFARLSSHQEQPRILCGDFNTPQFELEDGRIVTWGQRLLPDGKIVFARKWNGPPGGLARPDCWDRAERAILEGLASFPPRRLPLLALQRGE